MWYLSDPAPQEKHEIIGEIPLILATRETAIYRTAVSQPGYPLGSSKRKKIIAKYSLFAIVSPLQFSKFCYFY